MAPPLPENGVAFPKPFYDFNEEVQFQCQPGYTLVGDKSVVCQTTGVFTSGSFLCKLSKDFVAYQLLQTTFEIC